MRVECAAVLAATLLLGCSQQKKATASPSSPAAEPEPEPALEVTRTAAEPAPVPPKPSVMTADRAREIVVDMADGARADGPAVTFIVGGVTMVLVIDERANRMRIVSPISELARLDPNTLEVLMQANYHSALDARYALSEGTVFAAYIHPLSELTDVQLQAAVIQVANLVLTFGTEYSSTGLVFGAPGAGEPAPADPRPESRS